MLRITAAQLAMPPSARQKPVASPRRSLHSTGWRRLRYYYYRLLRLQGSPQAIARGLAAGVFAGCFPIFGLQTLVGIAIAIPARGNKIAAAAGTWVSNPFTYVPIYFFNLRLGEWLLGRPVALAELDWQSGQLRQQLSHASSDVALTLFLGCAVSGLVLSAVSYGLGFWAVRRFQRSRRQRRRQRRQNEPVFLEQSEGF